MGKGLSGSLSLNSPPSESSFGETDCVICVKERHATTENYHFHLAGSCKQYYKDTTSMQLLHDMKENPQQFASRLEKLNRYVKFHCECSQGEGRSFRSN